MGLGVLLDAAAAHFLEVLDVSQIDAVGVVDVAVGVGHGDHLGAQLGRLFAGVDGHVAGAGDDHGLALEAVVPHALQGLSGEVAQAVAGSLVRAREPPKVRPLPVSMPPWKLLVRRLYWPNI